MADNGTLSTKQRRLVAALATAPSVRDAARVANVGERTAWRWLAMPRIKAELSQRQDAMIGVVCAGLVDDMSIARRVLVDVAEDAEMPPSARVSAARGILDAGLRLAELWSLSDRVAALERKAASEPK